MDSSEVKEKLHQYIDNGDDALIHMMWEMVTSYNTPNNFSTIEQYNRDIEESLEQFKKGEFMSQKEVKEQSEKW
ncbi:hypothetical protein [Segetibacter aerophilus]|uniref:Uncharacterized protein n=1 Tax=Segetibacter aerophilus TaxID=670293 RepID=A0A512BFI2_9BACT|nr:hypothetical protein [Segetibacter aerophilus]GEO10720.1 hypothetical protein SAE01_32160 [Segetibacter aerophilus]